MHAEHRLRTTADFERARRAGRSWANALLVLNAVPNDRERTRCGFSVSRRLGNAVARNRVRRRLREIVRRALPAVRPGYDLVFVARAPAAPASYEALARAAHELLYRARLSRPARPEIGPFG